MKRFTFPLLALLLLAACEQPAETPAEITDNGIPVEWTSFGDDVTIDGNEALSVSELLNETEVVDDQIVRVDGNVVSVCTTMGCWLQLENPDGDPLRIHVARDSETSQYLWTFPTNLGPTPAIVQGIASMDTLSVAQQQHFLEDADAPQEEIDAITEPKPVIRFVAEGALLESVPAEEPAEEELTSADSEDTDA